MLDKLFNIFITITIGGPLLLITAYWIINKSAQKLGNNTNKKRPTSVLDQASKVSSQFNYLLKSGKLKREDILVITNILKKYSSKKYNNEAHMIYSILKNANVRMNELQSIDIFLESRRQKYKL